MCGWWATKEVGHNGCIVLIYREEILFFTTRRPVTQRRGYNSYAKSSNYYGRRRSHFPTLHLFTQAETFSARPKGGLGPTRRIAHWYDTGGSPSYPPFAFCKKKKTTRALFFFFLGMFSDGGLSSDLSAITLRSKNTAERCLPEVAARWSVFRPVQGSRWAVDLQPIMLPRIFMGQTLRIVVHIESIGWREWMRFHVNNARFNDIVCYLLSV